MRRIAAQQMQAGYKRTVLGKYRGAILDDQGDLVRKLTKRHKTAKEAKEHARRVIDIAAIMAVKTEEE